MKKIIKSLPYALLAMLPSALKIRIYNAFLGAEIDPGARIGLSFVQAKKIKIGPQARIGHCNIIRGLELLEMGAHATILNSNRITALPLGGTEQFSDETDRLPALILGAHSDIVAGHFLDCNNTVRIGHHTIVAGLGSAFFTHGINIETNKQESAPIEIGDYCMIGANCTIVKGAILPDYCVLGGGSTLPKPLDQTHTLYSGVPAKAVKPLDPAFAYFHRETGYVA